MRSSLAHPFLVRACLLACLLLSPLAAAASSFALEYRAALLPESGEAKVVMSTRPIDGRLVRVRIKLDPDRYSAVRADGKLTRKGEEYTWEVPREGGTMRYRVKVDHERRGNGHDARMTRDWALLRGDDLVPPLRATVTRGADARARLSFVLPDGWSAELPYSRSSDGKAFVIVDPERRMDRPEGWMLFGKIGVRRDTIAGMRVAVAAPVGQDVHRGELLAFVTALGPELKRAFGELPGRLLLVQAGDPMWRGGLSGPNSLYLHQDRPLISENGSSTPVHELVHVVTRLRGADGDDWIVEGLAEYYSIELTRRAGLLSDNRAGKAFDWMREHGAGVKRLHTDHARQEVTARAVTLFAALSAEIYTASSGRRDLDDVVQLLLDDREVSRESLRDAAREVLGRKSKVLDTRLLD